MLEEQPLAFSEMQEALNINSAHLSYHLSAMKELLNQTEQGKYVLSTFGEATISLMQNIEGTKEMKSKKRHNLWRRFRLIFLITILGVSISSYLFFIAFENGIVIYDRQFMSSNSFETGTLEPGRGDPLYPLWIPVNQRDVMAWEVEFTGQTETFFVEAHFRTLDTRDPSGHSYTVDSTHAFYTVSPAQDTFEAPRDGGYKLTGLYSSTSGFAGDIHVKIAIYPFYLKLLFPVPLTSGFSVIVFIFLRRKKKEKKYEFTWFKFKKRCLTREKFSLLPPPNLQ